MTSDNDTPAHDPFGTPPPGAPDSDWANAPTPLVTPADARKPNDPGDRDSIDDFFQTGRPDGEPDTIFDERAADTPAPRREMRISREQDGRRLPEGHIINERFEIRKCLGDGNVGTVYLVNDLRLKEKKALKLMHPSLVDSADAARRFITEIKMLQKLSHEYIVRIYDYGKTDVGELSFFTMEYVAGATLGDLLKKKGGRFPVDKAVAVFTQILETLRYAHQHTTHRNLKPINIMVRPSGKVVLLNFGISTTTSSTGMPAQRQRLGASHYQAPEQGQHPDSDDPRVDIYAAGVIFYQMLTGQIPLGQIAPPSRLNRDIPRALDPFLLRCLAPRPEDRFPTAEATLQALEKALKPASALLRILVLIATAAIGTTLWLLLRNSG